MADLENVTGVEFNDIAAVPANLNTQYVLTGDGRVSLTEILQALRNVLLNNIATSEDSAEASAALAALWAVSETVVSNGKYSAKYYAELAALYESTCLDYRNDAHTSATDAKAAVTQILTALAQVKESIDLEISKANNPKLSFNSGRIATSKSLDFSRVESRVFSIAWRQRISIEAFNALGQHQSGIIIGGASYPYYTLCKTSNNLLEFVWRNSSNSTLGFKIFNASNGEDIFDGNLHSIVLTVGESYIKLFVDDIQRASMASSKWDRLDTVQNFVVGNKSKGFNGEIFDVCVFNFDMSDDSAPYNFTDYASGKSIPLPLYSEAPTYNSQTSWTPDAPNNFTVSASSDEITVNCTVDYQSKYIWIRNTNVKLKAGDTITFNYDNFETNSTLSFLQPQASLRGYNSQGNVVDVINSFPKGTIKVPADAHELRIWINSQGAADRKFTTGEYFKITGLSVKVNGALIALDNCLNGAQVRDSSANRNHGNISGRVLGRENNPASASYELSWTSMQSNGVYCGGSSNVLALPANSLVTLNVKSDNPNVTSFKIGGSTSATQFSSDFQVSSAMFSEGKIAMTTTTPSTLYFTPNSAVNGDVKLKVLLKIERF